MSKLSEIDTWSQTVLWQVCHGGPYQSSVLLTLDLSDLGRLTNSGPGAHGMVEAAIKELAEHDLVVYRISEHHSVITRVAATDEAFSLLGFQRKVRVVGPRHAMGDTRTSFHPGDGSDFLNHESVAVGGPIEKLPIREHMMKYWSHAHEHFAALREIEERREAAEHLDVSTRDVSG